MSADLPFTASHSFSLDLKAISALITTVIRAAPIKLVGYSGLMLPVLEDELLAEVPSRFLVFIIEEEHL